MPEMRFDVRWPSGDVTRCYSPSLVVKELLHAQEYPIFEFLARVRAALTIGSERVRLKFGYYCTSAQGELENLEQIARRFSPDAQVIVLGLYAAGEPLPPLEPPPQKESPT